MLRLGRNPPHIESMRASSARLNAVAILTSVALFVALEALAMCLYPGGTWWDAHARGHRFWQNFLCDVEWRVALNGTPNPVGSRLALAAMATLALGLGPFWFATARLIAGGGRTSLAGAVRLSGIASITAVLAVISMPSDAFGDVHGAVVIVASLCGFLAASLAIGGLASTQQVAPAVLGVATMAAAVFDFILYASHFLRHAQDTPLTPAAEKVALGLLLSWMVAVARSEAS
jgi:hypothetical protein